MNNIEEMINHIKSEIASDNLCGHDELTVSVSDLSALIAQLEASQKLNPLSVNVSELEATYIGDIRLHMAAISNWKLRAQTAEAALSAANEKHGWIKRSDQMPDPNQQRRVCVFTPSYAADLRYRLVPANLFKAVCSSSTHWHYVNDPVEGNADAD